MKGTKFTVVGEVTKEAKAKLELMMGKLEQSLLDDIHNAKYDGLIKKDKS